MVLAPKCQEATNATTVEALIVVEGLHDTAGRAIESALGDLTSLLALYQPNSQATSHVLSPINPSIGAGNGLESPGPEGRTS